ncbi:MAG: hypothetical protein WCY22_01070 [Acholeplasmataceae bacterium]
MKKVYISILSIFLLGIAFGTVTYAWLEISNVNTIEEMGVTASLGDDLQVSLDGETYFNEITSEMLRELFGRIQLTDVTSQDGIHFETGGLRRDDKIVVNRDYLSFPIWFRTDLAQRSIYLVNNTNHLSTYEDPVAGTYVVSRGIAWEAPIDFTYAPNDEVKAKEVRTYYASNAIRMAFIEEIDETNPLDDRDESELIRFIYDPSENEERGFYKQYGALNYYIKRVGSMQSVPIEIPNTSYRLSRIASGPPMALDNESQVLNLVRTDMINERGRYFYQGKLTINVWVEGWDADAFDSIIRDRVKIQFEFRALMPAEEQD